MTDAATDPSSELVVLADHDSAFYWEGAGQGQLLAQRCAGCDRLWHPPGPVCPHCQSLDFMIAELPLEGVLYAAARVHEPGSPVQGADYLIVLVEIADPQRPADAVRIAGNLRGATLEEAVVGAPVSVHFEQLAGDHALPQFRLADGGGQ